MKVVAILGSPRAKGNCAKSLEIMGEVFRTEGIEFEIIHIGNKAIRGCVACRACFEMKNNKCVIKDETNDAIAKMAQADGVVLSSPVYFSGIAGGMKSFLDRAFYVAGANGGLFRGKVAGAISSVRRSGGSHTQDGLNHYITYGEMIVASSTYWNIVHGRDEGEVIEDHEGIQTVQVLARNIAWILKMKEKAAIPQPEKVEKIMTNFI